MKQKGFISLKEAAELADVSPITVRNWTRQGAVSYTIQNKRVWVSKDDVLKAKPLAQIIEGNASVLEAKIKEHQELVEEYDELISDIKEAISNAAKFPHLFNNVCELLSRLYCICRGSDDGTSAIYGRVIESYFLGMSTRDMQERYRISRAKLDKYMSILLRKWSKALTYYPTYIDQTARIKQLEEQVKMLSAEAANKEYVRRTETLTTLVDHLNLSVRTRKTLKSAGLLTVGDLLTVYKQDYYKLRNFGRKSMDELEIQLEQLGLKLTSKY